MKKLRIYLDTSVVNFLFADDAPEKRDMTREFFTEFIATRRYEACVSSMVLQEINQTPDAGKRSQLLDKLGEYLLEDLPMEPREEITFLVNAYIQEGVIPEKKYNDAVHVALCTVHEIDVLVSWNFDHLANVKKERRIVAVNQAHGYFYPLRITTPLEVMGDD